MVIIIKVIKQLARAPIILNRGRGKLEELIRNSE